MRHEVLFFVSSPPFITNVLSLRRIFSLPFSPSLSLDLSLSQTLLISRRAHNTVPRLSFVCFRYLYMYIYKNTKNNLQNDIISYITREFRYSLFCVGAPCKSLDKFQETLHCRFVTLLNKI